jgi:hypothetical protein
MLNLLLGCGRAGHTYRRTTCLPLPLLGSTSLSLCTATPLPHPSSPSSPSFPAAAAAVGRSDTLDPAKVAAWESIVEPKSPEHMRTRVIENTWTFGGEPPAARPRPPPAPTRCVCLAPAECKGSARLCIDRGAGGAT